MKHRFGMTRTTGQSVREADRQPDNAAMTAQGVLLDLLMGVMNSLEPWKWPPETPTGGFGGGMR
jgi:hypothetical protein